MNEKKVKEAIAKEKETIKTLEDAVVSGKTGSLRRWAKDTIENSTIIIEALEKQLPKKPVLKRNAYGGISVCPICGASDYGKYCRQCGQRIDREEEE